jgi:formylglycine-generating enzyme required for sulfatase activity
MPNSFLLGTLGPKAFRATGIAFALAFSAAPGVPSDLPAPASDLAPDHGYTQTIPGTKVSFDMVPIAGGVFWMGSPATERGGRLDESPRHRVQIRPFWMGKMEVTWDEYDLYRRGITLKPKNFNPFLFNFADAITRPSESYIDETRNFGSKGYPVVGITHHAAMEYCRWLSLMTGRVYRLPTEAEWEYACRAGSDTAYAWGNDSARLGEYGWFADNSEETTHPVGRKMPNLWGLHDMYGNVVEWCLDEYDADSYWTTQPARAMVAPVKLPTAARFPHVVRGGSWADDANRCRSACRRASDKSWNKSDPLKGGSLWWLADADFVGFRVVRAVEEQENLKGLRSKVTADSK